VDVQFVATQYNADTVAAAHETRHAAAAIVTVIAVCGLCIRA